MNAIPAARLDLVPATPADADRIRELAESIWWQAYPAFLSAGQIQFMLDWMYAPGQLRMELSGRQTRYQLLQYEGQLGGYCAHHAGDEPGEVHLSKFYLAMELHGRGLGSAALQLLVQQARNAGATCLTLRVNRQNHPALRCYLRNGFQVRHDVISHVGGGYVMDDHWMRLDLSTEPEPERSA